MHYAMQGINPKDDNAVEKARPFRDGLETPASTDIVQPIVAPIKGLFDIDMVKS